ncbi:hypothetical protein L208DRAFT_1405891 [Tricholoma matsutake]|nr:hypothetical protein L208DRAFT_1405891 [Tricholoma matsutake 945]
MNMAQPDEFCLVSHDPIFISNLFLCSSKGPKRREVCASPFLRISLFLLKGCYNKGMAQLGSDETRGPRFTILPHFTFFC